MNKRRFITIGVVLIFVIAVIASVLVLNEAKDEEKALLNDLEDYCKVVEKSQESFNVLFDDIIIVYINAVYERHSSPYDRINTDWAVFKNSYSDEVNTPYKAVQTYINLNINEKVYENASDDHFDFCKIHNKLKDNNLYQGDIKVMAEAIYNDFSDFMSFTGYDQDSKHFNEYQEDIDGFISAKDESERKLEEDCDLLKKYIEQHK